MSLSSLSSQSPLLSEKSVGVQNFISNHKRFVLYKLTGGNSKQKQNMFVWNVACTSTTVCPPVVILCWATLAGSNGGMLNKKIGSGPSSVGSRRIFYFNNVASFSLSFVTFYSRATKHSRALAPSRPSGKINVQRDGNFWHVKQEQREAFLALSWPFSSAVRPFSNTGKRSLYFTIFLPLAWCCIEVKLVKNVILLNKLLVEVLYHKASQRRLQRFLLPLQLWRKMSILSTAKIEEWSGFRFLNASILSLMPFFPTSSVCGYTL